MQLQPHPGGLDHPVLHLEGHAERGAGTALHFSCRLQGDLSALRLPESAKPVRADGLWRHTCFEAFITVPGSAGYLEFNFSPSGEWAAYQFTGYRKGMRPLDNGPAPRMHWHKAPSRLELDVSVDPQVLPPGGSLRIGLSAVIEERSGTISYWALRHPAEKPDFHHPDSFVLELPGVTTQEIPRT